MKYIIALLLSICTIAASAQTPQTGDITLTDPIQEIQNHFNLANQYSQSYNDYEVLCKYLEQLDIVNPMVYRLLQEEPENLQYQHIETILLYCYCHCLSQLVPYVDHTKMDDQTYAELFQRQRQICNEVIGRATLEENRDSYLWRQALLIAANTLGMDLVNDKTKATPEALTTILATFDTFAHNIALTEELYVLDTYIHLLLLNGDNEKAFQYIKKGCHIDNDHKDFVLLAARDDYHNWQSKNRANIQLSLDQRVRELRTQFIGQQAADTPTVSFCKETEKQAQKAQSNGKWTLLPLKEYIAKYGALPFDHIADNNSKQKVAVCLYDGDYVCDNFDQAHIYSVQIDNPRKLNIDKVYSDYVLVVVIKGNLIVKNNTEYSYFPPTVIVEQNLYANQLILNCNSLYVKGDIYVDELFIFGGHRTYACNSLHCGLDLTSSYDSCEESEVVLHPIIQRFGSLVDESLDEYQREAFLRKIVFELLQAGLISPAGATLLGIKHQDSYAKYLEPTLFAR